MCGFVGIACPRATQSWQPEAALHAMMHSLAHRGPDDSGVHVDQRVGVFMGFRRLSILDLSSAGHQPMVSQSGRFVITFNGEVYNFGDLRKQLESDGATFRSRSDTEVVLAAIEKWGCEEAVLRFRGMFAIAVWDRQDLILWLIRDRMGIKPLYLLERDGVVAYASEARAFHQLPAFDGRGSVPAAIQFLKHLYVPGSESILSGVKRVAPGEIVKLRVREKGAEVVDRIRYWSLPDVASAGTQRAVRDEHEAVDGLHQLLREAVRLRLIADVPVGAFLSGGLDSSVVVAVMQELASAPVKTFTIRFDDPSFDEGDAAALVARHLGTNHTAVDFTTADALGLIPLLPGLSDEPMANPSLLPTLLVSRVARRDVVVALSGDGGDELFGGYNRYAHGARLIRACRRVPAPLRQFGAALLNAASRSRLGAGAFELLRPASVASQQTPAERLIKIAGVLRARNRSESYASLLAVGMTNPPLRNPRRTFASAVSPLVFQGTDPLEAQMMLSDQIQYLPDDLLAKVDRASMWESLEARVPILDQEVVAYSWRLPTTTKIRQGVTKWPLRQIALRYLPPSVIERPKMGFTVPIASWMAGPLREWSRDVLSAAAADRVGLLDSVGLTRMWDQFESGHRELALPLWAAAVLHAWSDAWKVRFTE